MSKIIMVNVFTVQGGLFIGSGHEINGKGQAYKQAVNKLPYININYF